jgi:hypothetical protein
MQTFKKAKRFECRVPLICSCIDSLLMKVPTSVYRRKRNERVHTRASRPSNAAAAWVRLLRIDAEDESDLFCPLAAELPAQALTECPNKRQTPFDRHPSLAVTV